MQSDLKHLENYIDIFNYASKVIGIILFCYMYRAIKEESAKPANEQTGQLF